MPTSFEIDLPALYVEGSTDYHTIKHLLARHDIRADDDTGPVVIRQPKNKSGATGITSMLDAMELMAHASTDKPVGFVLDADVPVPDRWRAVLGQIGGLGLNLPPSPPANGYVGISPVTNAPVGVWIMPDNQLDHGSLEDLVKTLVPNEDPLFAHAESATQDARGRGARFSDASQKKAVLHCWLAWQKTPGQPFGMAIHSKFFTHDSPQALAFVDWFKRLYAQALSP